MKPLIVSRHSNHLSFEEERIRKLIKGSLEVNKCQFTSNVFDKFDLINFVNLKDNRIIVYAKDIGMPTVLFAFYSETNSKSKYLHLNRKRKLSSKIIKLFNDVDTIVVPCLYYKTFLDNLNLGYKTRILMPPVNPNRFKTNNINKNLFFKHYNENNSKKIILCVGDYKNKKDLEKLKEISDLCRIYKFYFIGENYTDSEKDKYIKKFSNNVVLDRIHDDELFKSLLFNVSLVVNLNGDRFINLVTYDAFQLKKLVITYSSKVFKDTYKDISLISDTSFDLTLLIDKCFNKKVKGTIGKAYNYVKDNTFDNSGKILIQIYKELLDKKRR